MNKIEEKIEEIYVHSNCPIVEYYDMANTPQLYKNYWLSIMGMEETLAIKGVRITKL